MELVHSSHIKKILKYAGRKRARYFLVRLAGGRDCDSGALAGNGITEVELDGLDDGERKACEKDYIENVAGIGFALQSREWWANPVSEKNEHVSDVFERLCGLYCLAKTLKRIEGEKGVVFIVSEGLVFSQLEGLRGSFKARTLDGPAWFGGLCRKAAGIGRAARSAGKVLLRKAYATCVLGPRLRQSGIARKNYIIRTWLDGRFLSEGPYRDHYFGSLPRFVAGRGYDVLVLAGIPGRYVKAVSRIRRTKDVLILPEELFIGLLEIVRAFASIKLRDPKLTRRVLFMGLDVTGFYEREIGENYCSPGYVINLIRYFIARRLAGRVGFEAYIQTFENYAWEKMSILGLREAKRPGIIMGFQHAFISRNSFKYFPGAKEKGIMPLPDRIVTMGGVTMEMLKRSGNYGEGVLRPGCALRQEYLGEKPLMKRPRFNRVLVPLTMVPGESLATMNFIHEAGLGDSGIEVVIRCHPSAPFESFSRLIGFKLPGNFIIRNESPIDEELARIDTVLYTWTTVSVEALKLGLPVIYLDIFDYKYVDPLFECSAFKAGARRPDQLMGLIRYFQDLSDEAFYEERQAAQAYLSEYFYKVGPEKLAAFLP